VPTLGHIAGSLAAALAVTLAFLFWISWPGFLAVGAGAVFGVAFLVVATSLGDDPRAADEAWRRHAADLIGTRGGSGADDGSAGLPASNSSPASTGASDDAAEGTPVP
jgi:hypothetical protein